MTGGIPVGYDFALEVGLDYVILDGRGGATGAAPDIFKNNISVPTMAARARARHHLDARGATGVTLIINGGLRTESDFVKGLALGADGVAISNSALQASGCLACPPGIVKSHPSREYATRASRRLEENLHESVRRGR